MTELPKEIIEYYIAKRSLDATFGTLKVPASVKRITAFNDRVHALSSRVHKAEDKFNKFMEKYLDDQ